jgi:ABC transporter with metal-binding/Fe-S-binding domain ATP-binding protein
MRVICLFSGGKDSTYAAEWAMKQQYEVVLLTVVPEPYSMMFHHPNVQWTKLQAEALGLELHSIEATEKNWAEVLEKKLQELKAEGIVTGAVASNYQKDRIEKIAAKLGIPSYAPLWNSPPEKVKELLDSMEVYISGVAAEGMTKEMLGKRVTSKTKLPKLVHPFFEGGEAETFVADAPLFKKKILITEWDISWDGVRGVAEIKKAKLVPKQA